MLSLRIAARPLAGRAPRVIVRNASASTKESGELVNPTPVAAPAAPRAKSSAAPGTVLKGLGYHQGKPDPIALPDEEYPAWLWKLLDGKADNSANSGFRATVTEKGKSITLDKKELRKKNRDSIRNSNFLRAQ